MIRHVARLALLCLVLSACAPLPQSEMTAQPRRQATFATGEELRPVQHPVLYDAITALRPTMLRTRGSHDALVVEIDGTVVGSTDVLRTIRTADVLTVERTSGLQQHGGQPLLRIRLRT